MTEQNKESLRVVVTKNMSEETVYAALGNVNRKVASKNNTVSPHCFAGHINLVGEGGGRPQGLNGQRIGRMGAALRTVGMMPHGVLFERLLSSGHLGGVVFARGQPDEAFLNLKVSERPDSPDGHSNLGGHFISKGDFPAAEASLLKALSLDPHHQAALLNFASLAARRGDLAEAGKRFIAGLAAQPEYVELYRAYAMHLGKQRQFVGALEIAERGLARHPNDANMFFLHGLLKLELAAPDDAAKSFRKALALGGDQKECHVKLSLAMHLAGEPRGQCRGWRLATGRKCVRPNDFCRRRFSDASVGLRGCDCGQALVLSGQARGGF